MSGYPASTSIPRVDGLSTYPRVLGRHIHYRSVGKNMGLPSEANVLENLPKQYMGSSDV